MASTARPCLCLALCSGAVNLMTWCAEDKASFMAEVQAQIQEGCLEVSSALPGSEILSAPQRGEVEAWSSVVKRDVSLGLGNLLGTCTSVDVGQVQAAAA